MRRGLRFSSPPKNQAHFRFRFAPFFCLFADHIDLFDGEDHGPTALDAASEIANTVFQVWRVDAVYVMCMGSRSGTLRDVNSFKLTQKFTLISDVFAHFFSHRLAQKACKETFCRRFWTWRQTLVRIVLASLIGSKRVEINTSFLTQRGLAATSSHTNPPFFTFSFLPSPQRRLCAVAWPTA